MSCTSSTCSLFGVRTGMSFSRSGVTTMKMMRRTSTTSTSGVTLMSLFACWAGRTKNCLGCFFFIASRLLGLLRLELLDRELNRLGARRLDVAHQLADVPDRQSLVALQEQALVG